MPGDIDTLLQNGYWSNTRAKSPDSRFLKSPTTTSSYAFNDTVVPRSSDAFNYGARAKRDYPPPPTVEDEAESIAKEHGSVVSDLSHEAPQNRGDVDQPILILDVHEHNPERRFVLVSNQSDSSDESPDTGKKPPRRDRNKEPPSDRRPERKSSYEANTGRKYEDAERRREPEEHEKRPKRERRKSRLEDLPAIVTDIGSGARPDGRPKDIRRAKSATGAEQNPDDYFSPRRSSRNVAPDSLLTPEVIKHSTKGRDRAYYDYSGTATPSAQARHRPSQLEDPQGGRSLPNQRRNPDGGHRPSSTSPVISKRNSTYDIPVNVRRSSKEGYEKNRQYSEAPPARLDRKNTSPPQPRTERDLRPRSGSFRGKRESPPYDDNRNTSDEDTKRRGDTRRRRKSFIHDERNGHLATPTELRPSGARKPKAPSPLASPRVSVGELYEHDVDPSPRSATFPAIREQKKFESSYASDEETQERPVSRASTRSAVRTSAPMAIPIIAAAAATVAAAAAAGSATSAEPGTPVDRRKSTMPLPQARTLVDSRANSHSSTSTPASSPPKQEWKPAKFDPALNGVHLDAPATSYRRYSEDAIKTGLPDLPDCPRTREEAGHVDWLTLPRSNSFNICPACYQSAFSTTEFRHLFVPAPFRPRDRPLKCDFGASQWYHIAWLLTHKYNKPDLRLLHGIANVTGTSQPCTGILQVYRIWYTIRDPVSQRPIRNFHVCHTCAKSIEVLLPNLSGVFVPMDSPAEPKRGICDMHQQSHGYGDVRKRFISYFDDMESTADKALATNTAPDIRSLADKVRERSHVDECMQGRPLRDGKWFTMRSIPDMTICEECFLEVVWPELERDEHGAVQGDFYQRHTYLPLAACQLYSHRMQEVFHKAVRRNDLKYFESRVRQRKEKEQEYQAQLKGLDRDVLGAEWTDAEIRRLQLEWAKWE